MRVTNSMIFGNTLNNVWRKQRHLTDLVTQIETGRVIQRPSEDPSISARYLRYRNILSETEQFLRNAHQGTAWMEVSESALQSVVEDIMNQMNHRFVEAANGTNTHEDRLAIIAELRELVDQIGLHMNQTYLGGYVFSGFRTNQPPILNNDVIGNFLVTQTFNASDIERTRALQLRTPPAMHHTPDINILKIPFRDVSFPSITDNTGGALLPNVGIFDPDGAPFYVITLDSSDADAYLPDDTNGVGVPVIHFIRDTGELVMSDATAEIFQNGTTITYKVTNPRAGDLNPLVYFPTVQLTEMTEDFIVTSAEFFDVLGDNIQMEIASGTHITINSLARNIFTDKMFADLRRLFEFADSITATDDSSENAQIQALLFDRFNNMLYLHNRHSMQAISEHTNLGSRMARLDMTQNRLEENEISYTSLLSAVIDTPYHEAITRLNNGQAAYQAALRANAMLMQLSLVNFIG